MENGLHKIENKKMSVTVNEYGAQMWSVKGADGVEYLWQGDPAYWSDRAISIFPYVARLTEGSYSMDGKVYQMGIHGFAAGSRFAVAKQESDCLVLELEDSEATYTQYPRHFLLRHIYRLKENTLEISFEVENRDAKKMYFGIGGHPGFNVPLAEGKKFEDYQLRFGAACTPVKVEFSEDCFVTGQETPFELEEGKILKLQHNLFDHDAIVLKGMDSTVTLECEDDSHKVTVSYPQMPYLGFWHMPKTDAPYVCIEPWCSLPAKKDQITVFEEQEDLICVEPGESYKNIWTITIA